MNNNFDISKLLDKDFWIEAWEKANQSNFDISDKERQKLLKEFWAEVSKKYSSSFESLLEERRKIVDFFISQEIVKPGQSLLDIGAGTGSFAIPLIEKGVKVTALDSSQKMFEEMKFWLEKFDLKEPEIVIDKFQDFSSEKKYDTVLASFTPAVKNAELLFKMEKFSNNNCILLASSDNELFSERHLLYEKIFNQKFKSVGFNAFFPLAVLFHSKRMPDMKIYETKETRRFNLDEEIDFNIKYFKTLGKDENETRPIIENYLKKKAENGIITKTTNKKTAVIWWNKFNDV
jgi:cyclopropane fatty-acyl-phospholipid synthase-like methyltransferase